MTGHFSNANPGVSAGFTLMETLVALLLLTILVPAVLEFQIAAIRAERAMRAAKSASLEINRIMVQAACGADATNGVVGVPSGCSVQRSIMRAEKEPGPFHPAGRRDRDMVRWEIVPDDRPALRTIIFTRLFPEKPSPMNAAP